MFLKPLGISECVVITSDFHMNRSRFIFNWVLGSDYTIHYVSVASQLTKKQREQRGRLERTFIAFIQDHLVEAIPAGDDEQIEEFMECGHLRYCLSPLSEAMLAVMMETAAIKAGY
jgi:hypothetical protein